MKIKKIRLENHPVLKNLELDFTDENGSPIDTIILAGENGTGKTSILEIIYELTSLNFHSTITNEKRIFEIELKSEELEIISKNTNYTHFTQNGFLNGNFTITLSLNESSSVANIIVDFKDSMGNEATMPGQIFQQNNTRNILNFIYSDVEINYSSPHIINVTSKELDQRNQQSFKSNGNLAAEIKQLLIDIQSQDAHDFSSWGKRNLGSVIDESQMDKRIKRFTKAFDTIFPSKKFLGIENLNNRKEVFFEENGYKMPIEKLSSGEKQIVFRGGFFLKDKLINQGAIMLIDEPEISLHPKWQLQILDFYKNIINSETENQSQIFITTHSPFIIHNSNRRNDKVIVLSRTPEGNIITLDNPKFYSWTSAKIVKEAFQIDFSSQNQKNKLFVEGETDEKYLNKVKELFDIEKDVNFDISWIGRINEKGGNEFSGDTALNHASSFFKANKDLLHSKIVLFYDNDTKKPEESYDNLFIRVMPHNTDNTIYKIGIENLLTLPADFNYSEFYTETKKVDDYGAESIIKTLNKTKLCNWICDECEPEQQLLILEKFSEMLKSVETSINN